MRNEKIIILSSDLQEMINATTIAGSIAALRGVQNFVSELIEKFSEGLSEDEMKVVDETTERLMRSRK